MKKKNRLKVTAAACLALAMTLGATGCDAFLTTDSEKNLKQIVAQVNISSRLEETEGATVAQAVQSLIDDGGLLTDIPKRDLVAYFMSQGYQYVESYGYSYKDTFEMLLDSLIERKVLVQYAVAHYLKTNPTQYTQEDCDAFVEAQINNAATQVEKRMLQSHPEVLTLQYFLSRGNNAETENYDEAIYQLNKSVNDSLDTTEANYIKAKDDSHTATTPRTLPTNVGTEKSDYYIAPSGGKKYTVYTGYNNLADCYRYEAVDGSTATTRIKAYNSFLKNLQSNGLILKGENTTDFTKMDYYYVEMANQLEAALIDQYTEDLKKQGEEALLADDYVVNRYKETLATEKTKYSQSEGDFETAINGLSDTSFALYSPSTDTAKYGFVYNILIPFSKIQTDLYDSYSALDVSAKDKAAYRAKLLQNVEAKDLRDSWFSDYEDDNYAYEATDYYDKDGDGSNYLFFEDNFTNTERYESLGQYTGKYAFNGSVTKNADDEFVVKANKMKIDGFINEVTGYIESASGRPVVNQSWTGYVSDGSYSYDEKEEEFTDYGEFMYYAGKVDFTETFARKNYFVESTEAYKAVSAFNELMFAYSTDTGCLNTYMGYVVSPYKTSFVGEFEYAAQYAINNLGVGGITVCESQYGWHVIYVSCVYEAGEVYGTGGNGFNVAEKDTEGTFSNMYFEMVKSSFVDDYATEVRSAMLKSMNTDSSVTRYSDRYKDLTELDD